MCVKPFYLRATGRAFPCGFCVECRAKYARSWALRCLHESQLHESCCYGTLTYQKVPSYGTLVKRDLQLFWKRLRKSIEPKKVKYYAAGEYGEENGRPHYHFLLFGHAVSRGVVLREEPYPLFRSPELEELWPAGMSSVGDVSFESAAYVARYVMKKVDQVGRKKKWNVDEESGEMVEIEPEFATMSRGGRTGRGLGHGWYERFGDEVHRNDSCVHDGKELPVPRYYDELLRERDVRALMVCKARRERKYGDKKLDLRELMAREVIAVQRLREAERAL